MGVAAGVELDDRRLEADRRLDLARIGLDEQADPDVGAGEALDEGHQVIVLARRVEPALGGPLLALLGDEAGGVGPVAKRDLEHLLGRRHLEVEGDGQPGHQLGNVLVADVAAVFAKMGGDPVGAGLGGEQGGPDRIGKIAAARVPDRRDMVDIDSEAEDWVIPRGARQAAFRLPGFSAGRAASSGGSASGS